MVNHPDAFQISRRSQCSSESVRTTWLYCRDAIQYLISIRVSASRHSYGNTIETVRTMSFIRQVVHTNFNNPGVSLHGPDDQASYICKLHAPVQPSAHQPSGSRRSNPYYGNYVQPKCNRSDARATPSGRGLVMEAFRAILERQFQLTVRTLGQAVRTPTSILIITFWSNIGLGQNWSHWKANEK
jgi:hypothetical protein